LTKQTTSLSLSKPEITDKIVDTITQLASNFDVIDSSLADKATYFNTVADMKAANLKVGDKTVTFGYYSFGDGGGATYKIVATGTGTVDNGSFISLTNGLQAQLNEVSYTNVKQFGARGDGITDDSNAIIANLAWGGMLGHKVRIPWGSYYITKTVTLNNQHLEGDGWHRTYLKMGLNGQLKLTGLRNTVEKLDISGTSSTNYSNIGIELTGCSHSVIRECNLYYFNNALKVGANTWSNTFIKINTYFCDIAFNLNGGQINNTSFYHCHAVDSRIGFNCISGDSDFHYKISFYSCQIERNSDAGTYINSNGTYSFHGCHFEANNTTNQTGIDKGGVVISFPGTFGARLGTIDLVGCYHLQSNIRLKQSGSNTTTLISNYFKDIQATGQYAIELLNAGANSNKVLNINPFYEMVTTITNSPNDVYDLNSNKMYGTTSQRPTNATGGQTFFDTTFNKPIFWDGFNWRGSNGLTPELIGKNVAITASAVSYNVSFSTNQFTTDYAVDVSLGWNSTYWITNKASTGFTINFGTAPVSASTLDWKVGR
jgi:hypothetical protein